MYKAIYLYSLLCFLGNNVFANEMDKINLQDTNCSEYNKSISDYELTYEEKMQIASSKFEATINKNEQACDPNFSQESANSSASEISGSSAVAGGITGQETLEESTSEGNEGSNFGSNSLVEEEQKTANKSSKTSKNGQNIIENGKIPECISRIGGDDEISMQIKESISMVSDENQKKALIKAYSDYKGLNIDPDKC
tara:strand:- start:1594 stop:2184 length:591 start_codon:yes stop_codon:yes gene_type:complete